MKTRHVSQSARGLVSVLGLLSVLALLTGSAAAQCGNPATSNFPTHITVCPSGDIAVVGQVLDAAGNPCVGSVVHMQFQPPATGALYPMPGFPFPLLTSTTNLNGFVSFHPHVGGSCLNGAVTFYDPSGVILGTAMTINSPDMNADGCVNLADISLFASVYYGSYSGNADFNMDGVLNLTDVGILAQHLGH